jgi:hypothetical protein
VHAGTIYRLYDGGDQEMPSLKDFIEAMNASWPVALTVLAACCGLLISDALGLSYLAGLPLWVLSTTFIIAVFAAAVVVVRILQGLISAVTAPLRNRRWNAAVQAHLKRMAELPPEEGAILAWAVANKRQVFIANLNEPLLAPLVAKGFIERVSGHHSILEWPYRIPDHIWDELMRQWKKDPFEANYPNPFVRGW